MIEIKEDKNVKYAVGWCQFCGKLEKADVGSSTESSAKVAVRIKLDLHENKCSENPDLERSDMDKYLSNLMNPKS